MPLEKKSRALNLYNSVFQYFLINFDFFHLRHIAYICINSFTLTRTIYNLRSRNCHLEMALISTPTMSKKNYHTITRL